MFSEMILAIFLCGVTWAGTCQAESLGNNQDQQFLHNISNSGDTNDDAAGSAKGMQVKGLDNSQKNKVSNLQSVPGDVSTIANDESVTQGVGTNLTILATTPVPEPGTSYLVGFGLTVLGVIGYRKRRVKRVKNEAPVVGA